MKQKIAVFDFDGTLIKEDSMLLFFKRYFNFRIRTIPVFFRLLLEASRYFRKIYTQKEFKEIYINLILSTNDRGADYISSDFGRYLNSKIYKDALDTINELKESGYSTILLSASTDLYLKEMKHLLGFDKLLCTMTAFNDGKIKITGRNCYGPEKLSILLDEYGEDNLDLQNSYCFADSKSDLDLMLKFGNSFSINNKKLADLYPQIKLLKWK